MKTHSEVLYVLYVVLIEIRAAENLKKAKILADIVHNVPMMLNAGHTADEIYALVMRTAKRQGTEGYFSKLFDIAKNR